MKILSIDDDPIFLEVIKAELNDLGFHDVDQVQSGVEALQRVREGLVHYDCFLLDIDMPGMSGVELCSFLREEPAVEGLPIIMVTSRAELENVDKAFAAGATDYLNKPLSRRELRGRLQMAQSLMRERNAKKDAASSTSDVPALKVSDALFLDGVAAGIDYIAMQNYVLKLGSMQMFNRVAIGVHVPNIHEIFATKDAQAFRDTLLDVAEILVESVGPGPKMISYAGSGDFIILVNRFSGFDQSAVVDAVSLKLSTLSEWYVAVGEIPPRLKLGTPIGRSLVSFHTAEEILSLAIDAARQSGTAIEYRAPVSRDGRSKIGATTRIQ
jgi:CheY-like chemotaxis protein